MKASQFVKQGKFVWRWSHIGFAGKGDSAPARVGDEVDKWDRIFDSKSDFDKWFREVSVGLAEVDEIMNFCSYFVRTEGNKGLYVRDGKSFPVCGTWSGNEDFACAHSDGYPYKYVCCEAKKFVEWLNENGFRDSWFRLHERYLPAP